MEVFITEQGIATMTVRTDNIFATAVTKETIEYRTLRVFAGCSSMSATPAVRIMTTGTGDHTHGFGITHIGKHRDIGQYFLIQ